MTDQQLVVSALRPAGLIVAEPGACDADEAITQLIAVLDCRNWLQR